MKKVNDLIFFFCFWVAFVGLFFIGMGAKINDTDLMFFGLPFAFFGTVLAVITYKISLTFKA